MFTEIGGFDEANSPAADYDLYLRVARQFPIICHHQPVVKYRRHGANMSSNSRLMLASTVTALKKQLRHVEGNQELLAAYDMGLQQWRRYYGEPMIATIFELVPSKYTLLRRLSTSVVSSDSIRNCFLTFIGRKIAYLISLLPK